MKNFKLSRNIFKADGNKKKSKRTIISLTLALTLIVATFSVAATGNTITSPNQLGDSSSSESPILVTNLPLGTSSITTVEELETLSKQSQDGTTFEGITFELTQDLSLTDLIEWKPIGTVEAPFKGTFDGKGFTISGVGSVSHPSLFGFIENATLKNLTVKSGRLPTDDNPYLGLFIRATNSTIENCHVLPAEQTFSRALLASAAFTPDASWVASKTITKYSQLMDFAMQVNGAGGYAATSFAGDTITINLSHSFTDDQARAWRGIGSREDNAPFSGTIENSTITGLKIYQQGLNDVGLFSYTKEATFRNVALKDIDIIGGNNTGGLIGYAEDTTIEDSSVMGSVTGHSMVGGFIGNHLLTAPILATWHQSNSTVTPLQEPQLIRSYSGASVSGTLIIGGLIGQVDTEEIVYTNPTGTPDRCLPLVISTSFVSGKVQGILQVGGAIGRSLGTYSNSVHATYPIFRDIGVNGLVEGSSQVGGIIGTTTDFPSDSTYPVSIEQCYFAGTLHGYHAAGGLVGSGLKDMGGILVEDSGQARHSYVSGKVIVPSAQNSDINWPTIGFVARKGMLNAYLASEGLWAGSNSIYESSNVMNENTPNVFEKKTGQTGSFTTSGLKYFREGGFAVTGFTAPILTYPAVTPTNHHEIIPASGGIYPVNSAIAAVTGPNANAFAVFSKVSTSSNIVDLPLEVSVNASTNIISFIGSDLTLDSTDITWTFADGNNTSATSLSFADTTLANNENLLTIEAGGVVGTQIIKAAAPFAEQQRFTLVGTLGSLGIKIVKDIVISDQALRFEEESVKGDLYVVKADAFAPTSPTMSVAHKVFFLSFPEQLNSTVTGTGTLIGYDDAAFTAGATTPITVTATVVNNTYLRLLFTGILEFEKYYELDLSGLLVEDIATPGNPWVFGTNNTFYFRTGSNDVPALFFLSSAMGQTTTPEGQRATTQTVRLIENSPNYTSILDGLDWEHSGGYVDVLTDTNIATVTTVTTVGGKGHAKYPTAPPDTDKAAFLKVPGTYTVSYKVADPDYPPGTPNAPESVPIVRTYEIYSAPQILQGGAAYKMLHIDLDDTEVAAINETSSAKGISLQEALLNAINAKFLTSATPADKLTAFYFSPTGDKQDLDITFDTSTIPDKAFAEGLETVVWFSTSADADGQEHMALLSLASLTPTKEILFEGDSSIVLENLFSKQRARAAFGAYVFDKTENARATESVDIDFSKIDRYKFDIPQEVTLTVLSTVGRHAGGKDMMVSAKGFVTIKKVIIAEEEDVNPNMTFWTATLNDLRAAKDNTTHNVELSYDNGRHARTDLFRVLRNKENVTANLKYPSGITLTLQSESMKTDNIDDMIYNLAVERMYDLYISRDAGRFATQQFSTDTMLNMPGNVILSMPLDEKMLDQNGLLLYTVDEDTGNYVLHHKLSSDEISNGNLVLTLDSFEGRYVLTGAKLEGTSSTSK